MLQWREHIKTENVMNLFNLKFGPKGFHVYHHLPSADTLHQTTRSETVTNLSAMQIKYRILTE